jgi:hypothetical protein
VIHNWSWEPTRVEAPMALTDVLDDAEVPVGTTVMLGAWDVRVFVAATDPGEVRRINRGRADSVTTTGASSTVS